MSETMRGRYGRLATGAAWLAMMTFAGAPPAVAQPGSTDEAAPDLAGIWDGSPRSHPINGVNQPWTPDNFPVLNERGIVKLSGIAIIDPQHTGFATGLEPIILGVGQSLILLNLTIPDGGRTGLCR